MLTQEQLTAYFEHQLPPVQRAEFERMLADDQAAQWSLADQENIDLALRVLLGKAEAHDRVKESIFTVLRGASVEQLTAQVMEQTRAGQAAEVLPPGGKGVKWIKRWVSGEQPDEASESLAPAWSQWMGEFQARLRQRWALSVVLALALLGCGLFLLFRPAPAAGILVGQFAAVIGQPTLQHGTRSATLNPQLSTPVHLGDRIETGDADRAEVQFNDGTTLRLHFNTVVEVQSSTLKVRGPESKLDRPSEILLLRGQVWTKVQTLTNAPQYAVKTPVATAIARGTEFGVKLQRSPALTNAQTRNSIPETNLLAVLTVKEGAVDFTNALGTVRATAMTESTASAGSAPTEPKRLQTLQTVQFGTGSSWSLVTSALTLPDAAEKLAGGGGWAGLKLRDFTGAPAVTNAATPGMSNEVRVAQVFQASPASLAGLKAGDVLLALDGRPATNAIQVEQTILMRPNTGTALRFRRGGEEQIASLTITNQAGIQPGPTLSTGQRAQLANLTREFVENTNHHKLGGRLVSEPGSAGIRAGETSSVEDRRYKLVARLSGSNSLQAAAQNNLGVVFESEDALGPAIRAYGRAAYIAPEVPLYRFNLGLALRKIGSFERAEEELEAVARLAPVSTEPRKWLASTRSLLGRHQEALTETEAALVVAPRDHSLWELKAQLLTKQSRFSEALEAAQRSVELDASCPVAHGYVAGALHNLKQLAEAEAAYRKAIDLAPFNAPLHMNFGTVQRDRQQLWPAEQSFRKAIELQPDFALAYLNLGNLLADSLDFAAASAALQKARELDPTDANAHLRFGDMALKRRQFDQAERAYRDALEASPGKPEALYGLGEAHRLQRRSADAERAYRKAIELRPDYAEPHIGLGIVFYDRGDIDEAEKLYRRAIELNPREAAPYHNLGTLYQEARGDMDGAEKWFRQALERSPDDGESLGGLGLIAGARGNLVEAERLLRRALEREPNSSGINNNLGEMLRQRGRPDEAEPFYKKALELDPDNTAPYGNLGILYAMRKQFAEAERTFRALLERSSGTRRLPALVNLANVCGEQGKLDEAEGYFRQALQLAPNHPQVSNSLASFLADHLLKLDEALALATRAVAASPNDPNFIDTLGWVQAQRGELEQAEKSLNKALALAGNEPPAPEIREHLKKLQEKKGAVPK